MKLHFIGMTGGSWTWTKCDVIPTFTYFSCFLISTDRNCEQFTRCEQIFLDTIV